MTSRLRHPRARCRATRGPEAPRRVMACGDGSALVLWAAQAHAIEFSQPLAGLLSPLRGWDLDAPERESQRVSSLDLIARLSSARAKLRALPAPRYTYRTPTTPPPLRQRGVALPPGATLAAALADIADAPRWVDPVRAALAVVANPRSTRAQIRAALEGKAA